MSFTFYQIVAFFFVYSFIGWCVEVAYQGVTNGKVVNRGFLNGPVCPIYGVGMVGVLLFLTPISDNLFLLFVGGIIITTTIELFGGWILDRLFHMRWWDYSDKPFNLNGYICLEFCIIWGLGVIGVVSLFHPMVEGMVNRVPKTMGIALLMLMTIGMIADIIVTYKEVIGITRSLGEAERIAGTLRDISDNLSDKVGNTAIAATEKAGASKEKLNEAVSESKEKLNEAVSESKDKLNEVMSESKEKLNEAMVESREKFSDAMSTGKEMIASAVENSKDIITESITTGVDKISDSLTAGKEMLSEGKEKISSSLEAGKEMEEKKREMEKRYAEIMESLQRKTKRFSDAFPSWHLSNDKKSVRDYIKNLRK